MEVLNRLNVASKSMYAVLMDLVQQKEGRMDRAMWLMAIRVYNQSGLKNRRVSRVVEGVIEEWLE